MKVEEGFDIIICTNCGSNWRIERFWEQSDIIAELIKCPLCAEVEKER
jgi:hypothetical protein